MPLQDPVPTPEPSSNGATSADDALERYLVDPLLLLDKDVRAAAALMTPREARYLVSTYYQLQEYRIASESQERTLTTEAEPHICISWTQRQMLRFEDRMRALLDVYTMNEPTGLGQFSRTIPGIGPVLAAGLLAYLDITKAPTVGHWWRYGGLVPEVEWFGTEKAKQVVEAGTSQTRGTLSDEQVYALANVLKRNPDSLLRQARYGGKNKPDLATPTVASLSRALARRPWNAALKVIYWKLGESFVKTSGKDNDIYGHLYLKRKVYEQAKNERGEYAEQAAEKLRRFSIDKSTEAYKWYSQGKLPPGHLHARAKRYSVKAFLASYHAEAYWRYYHKAPPLPYPIQILGHAHLDDPSGVWSREAAQVQPSET